MALGRQKGWTDESVLARMEAIDDEMVATGSSSTTVVRTDDFLLLRYPDDLRSPTMGQAQAWVLSSSPFSWFEEEAAAHVRGWGIDEVWWWVDHAAPEATVAAIAARTGDPVDDVQLLGLPLEKPIISSALPRVELHVVTDRVRFDDAMAVTQEGWHRPPATPAVLDARFDKAMLDLTTGAEWTVVAYLNGNAASVGRARVFDDTVRLYGGVTLPWARRQGLYRAVLCERIRGAQQRGATLAVTSGRVATSAPILRQAGFRVVGWRRAYRLELGA